MKHYLNLQIISGILFFTGIAGTALYAQKPQPDDTYYKIKAVYVPLEKRPALEYNLRQVPFKNASGQLPAFEGENFQLNINGQSLKEQKDAKQIISSFLEALKSPLRMDEELRQSIKATTLKANPGYIDEQIRLGKVSKKEKLKREMNDASKSSANMLDELGNDLKLQADGSVTIYRYDQYFKDVIIDNTAISVSNRSANGITSVHGKFYNTVKPSNNRSLPLGDAVAKAIEQLRRENKYEKIRGSEKGEMVLLPYADGFNYAWKTTVTADGPYEVWIDAENGKVLQLFPLFFFSDNAKGLVFNPDPFAGTKEMTFEVNAPSGGIYTLTKTGYMTMANAGADGTTGVVQVNDDGSGTANFNIAPINGTVVEKVSLPGYNGLFQQVNTYAHTFNERKYYELIGSENFGVVNITVNQGGEDNAHPNSFFTCSGTLTGATGCGNIYNTAIDATVVAHEFGHVLDGMQYALGGGHMTGALNEGMSDYWSCTTFNMDIVAGWTAHNCPTPVQSGWLPRQMEALDVFPDHKSLAGASNENHSAGQIIAWAMWNARQRMNDATTFGTLSLDMNTLKAETTAGVGVLLDGSDKSIHDSYQNLLKQLAPLYQSSRMIHKLLAGYASAGIFLSPKDAVIDIDHAYLNRNNASGPVFTVWTGDDYTFSGNNVVTTGTLPFNTQYMIEVANDEAFTTNLVSSGWQGGVATAAGGTATWTLPVANWNTLKAGTDIYYKVTTRDGNGGNTRTSLQPGNNFLGAAVPAGRAAINGTGTKDCSCTASSAGQASSAMALIPLLPIAVLIIYRRRKMKYVS